MAFRHVRGTQFGPDQPVLSLRLGAGKSRPEAPDNLVEAWQFRVACL